MNAIAVKPMQTPYGYKEQHLMIDGLFLPYYVDSYAKASEEGYFKGALSLLGLYPAWGKDLLHRGEIRFIWNLIDREEPVVLPLLVCEDDLDLSCIVIVAFVRKGADIVYWDRIGFVSREEWKLQQEIYSGILHLESYTDEDWIKYGDNIALEQPRCMNYTLPYYLDENHIIWLQQVSWEFDRKTYESCVDIYRKALQWRQEETNHGIIGTRQEKDYVAQGQDGS